MNENQLTIAKENFFDKPLVHKIDSISDICIIDCHNKYFHTFDHICEEDIKFKNTNNNEIINSTIFDKNMASCELKQKLKSAGQN